MRILQKFARGAHIRKGGLNPLNHDGFDLARTAPPECSGVFVFRRCKTGDDLLKGGKFDHDDTREFVRTFHDLKTPTPSQYLAAELCNDCGHKVRVLLVLDGVVDL